LLEVNIDVSEMVIAILCDVLESLGFFSLRAGSFLKQFQLFTFPYRYIIHKQLLFWRVYFDCCLI